MTIIRIVTLSEVIPFWNLTNFGKITIQEMNKIKKLKNKNEQMTFATILRTFVHIDKETLAYMKYLTEKYV